MVLQYHYYLRSYMGGYYDLRDWWDGEENGESTSVWLDDLLVVKVY
jgi:hypothetical protein